MDERRVKRILFLQSLTGQACKAGVVGYHCPNTPGHTALATPALSVHCGDLTFDLVSLASDPSGINESWRVLNVKTTETARAG